MASSSTPLRAPQQPVHDMIRAEPLPHESDPEFLAMLDESLDQAERGETELAEDVIARLRAKRARW